MISITQKYNIDNDPKYDNKIQTKNININQLKTFLNEYIIEIDISNMFLKEIPSQIYNLTNIIITELKVLKPCKEIN